MDWWTIPLTLIVGALCVYSFFTRNYNFFKNRGVPFLKPFPIFGNMIGLIFGTEGMVGVLRRAYDCHPDAKYVGYFDFSTPVIVLRDPELVKSITIKNFDSFPNHRMFAESSTEPLFQKNLFALKDDAWRDMRPLLSPAFTSSKMRIMFKSLAQCAKNFADHLSKLDPRPDEFDLKDTFGRYTLDVIASAAFGLSVDSMKDRDNEFYRLGKSFSEISGLKMIKFLLTRIPWLAKLLNVRMIDDKTSEFFINIIENTIANRDAEGIVRPDMINLMMRARDRKEKTALSSVEMTAQAFIFLLGGFDSPATAMSFAALALALHPDVQRKLQSEIDEVLENSSNGEVSHEDLHAMKYLDAVVNETLRMFPPAPFLDRIGPNSFTLPPALPGLEPFKINPGQNIWIPVYNFHHDGKYFQNPGKFDPERFNDDNKSKINPLTYMPFGIGPRSCIANRFALMEVKLVLFHLLAECNLLPTSKTKSPIKLGTDALTMRPEGGFGLKIEPRK